MNQPVSAAPPVNALITVQPLTTAIPNPSTDVPTQLPNVPVGTTVEGFVINRDAQNNPILRTPQGDVLIKSDIFIKTGSEVAFRIDATHGSRARIITIDGLTPQDYSVQTSRGLTQDTISPSQLQPTTGQVAAPPVPGNTTPSQGAPILQAVVLQPTANQMGVPVPQFAGGPVDPEPVPAALAQLPAGAQVKLTILNLELPPAPTSLSTIPEHVLPSNLLPPSPQQASAALPPQVVAGQAPPAQVPAQAAVPGAVAQPLATLLANEPAVAPNPLLPTPLPNVPLVARPATSIPAQGTPPAMTVVPGHASVAMDVPDMTANTTRSSLVEQQPFSSSPLASPPLHAAVIGHEADGANILQMKFATLKLYTNQPLPVGTTLSVQATPDEEIQPPLISPISDELQQTITTLTRDWQHLGDALNLLQATDPAAARDMLQQMPTVSHKLTSGMLFFLAAVKGGGIQEWLGQRTVRKLESAAPELLSRLRTDMTQMQQMFNDSPLTNWSGVMLPMLFGQELQQARLYIRREDENNGGDNKKGGAGGGQRFIIEVGMSQLGDLQFDGFVRGLEKGKAFDLIIRSDRPLPPAIAAGIKSTFDTAMQASGLRGQLGFQQGSQHFVRPLADTQNKPPGDALHTILA